MDSIPGNVYDSDLILMNPTDSLYMPLLAGTNMHAPWPVTAVDLVPGHIVPEPLGVYETGDNSDFNQPFHQDWTTQGTWNTHPDQLVGHGVPFATSPSDLNPIGEDAMPLSDFSDLFPPPNHVCDSWKKAETFDLYHSLIPEFAVTKHAPWPVMNPFEFGFDAQNIPQSHYEDVRSDSTHICEWRVDGSPCNRVFAPGDNLKHSISQHLSKVHSLLPSSGKSTQKCQWVGCTKELKQESIVRHILTVHLRVTTACEVCGTAFARQDSLQRHIRKSCGTCKGKR